MINLIDIKTYMDKKCINRNALARAINFLFGTPKKGQFYV